MKRFLIFPVLAVLTFVFTVEGVKYVKSQRERSYEMAGEATQQSVILQTRLAPCNRSTLSKRNKIYFQWEKDGSSEEAARSQTLEVREDQDCIVKAKAEGLRPGTRYLYQALSPQGYQSAVRSFRTLPENIQPGERIRFVATGCANAWYFWMRRYGGIGHTLGQGWEGYPALAAIRALKPDFLVNLGDGVYYDSPRHLPAKTEKAMRVKWHEQHEMLWFDEVLGQIPSYWMMDDHDYRFNNSDPWEPGEPSGELGLKIFLEQLPIRMPEDEPVLYRTYTLGTLAQFWLLDNRTQRSPNRSPDGPQKTLWGETQRTWLKNTLAESNAAFKFIFTSTTMIGPDKKTDNPPDNHLQIGGFQTEHREFFEWMVRENMLAKNVYFIAGDAHIKQHTQNPQGFEEFTVGRLDKTNSNSFLVPGMKNSSDPEGKIHEFYVDPGGKQGGFLRVDLFPSSQGRAAEFQLEMYDDEGRKSYEVVRRARVNSMLGETLE